MEIYKTFFPNESKGNKKKLVTKNCAALVIKMDD